MKYGAKVDDAQAVGHNRDDQECDLKDEPDFDCWKAAVADLLKSANLTADDGALSLLSAVVQEETVALLDACSDQAMLYQKSIVTNADAAVACFQHSEIRFLDPSFLQNGFSGMSGVINAMPLPRNFKNPFFSGNLNLAAPIWTLEESNSTSDHVTDRPGASTDRTGASTL